MAGVPWGGPEGSSGCPLPGPCSSWLVGGLHQEARLLHLPWMVWQLWAISHQHSHSAGCSRRHRRHPPVGDKEQVPSVAGHAGDSVKRWAPSPSPARLRRWVTFEEHGTGGTPQYGRFPPQPKMRRHPAGACLQKGTLGPHPFNPDLEYFLGECMFWQVAEGRRDPQQNLWPKPPLEDHCKCIE